MIETERLILRRWREEDRQPFAALNADPEVMAHYPAPLTREQSDAVIDRHEALHQAGRPGVMAVEVIDTGAFIGYVGLAVPPFDAVFTPCVEIGWRLARPAWGHGYATEAANAALTHGFNTLMLTEIVSFTSVGNERSRAVMRRIGMTHDPAEDFDHPRLPEGHELRRHVLYRISSPSSPR